MLKLPKPISQRLAKEFRYAADEISKAQDLQTKLYYLSVFFGETNRALNLNWDRELVLLHMVVRSAHQDFSAPHPPPITISEELINALTSVVDDLAGLFQLPDIDTGKLHRVLAELAALSYVTTGNGYYLLKKGDISELP